MQPEDNPKKELKESRVKDNLKDFVGDETDDEDLKSGDQTADTESKRASIFGRPSLDLEEYLDQDKDTDAQNAINKIICKFANSSDDIIKEDEWKRNFEMTAIRFIGSTMVNSLTSTNAPKLFPFQSRFLANLAKKSFVKATEEELIEKDVINNMLPDQNEPIGAEKNINEKEKYFDIQMLANNDIEDSLLPFQIPSKLDVQLVDDEFYLSIDCNEKLIKIKQNSFENLLMTHFKLWVKRLSSKGLMEQFEESLKLQLGESCQKEGYILSGLNPYICVQEIMQLFIKKGANINSKSIKFIEIKGLIFNKVICAKIEEFLSYISKKTRFGVNNAEFCYIKNEFSEMISAKERKKLNKRKRKAENFEQSEKDEYQEISSENFEKLIVNDNSLVTLNIPKVKSCDILINDEHRNMIEYFVYVDQPYSEFYDNKSNKWSDRKDVPKIKKLMDFKKQSIIKSFLSEEVKKIIASKKRQAVEQFSREISKSVDALAKLTRTQVEEMKKNINEEVKCLVYIKDYPWFNGKSAVKLYKEFRNKSEEEVLVYRSFYIPNFQNEHKDNQAFISEYWFNSFSKFLYNDYKAKKNEKGISFKVNKRHSAIKYAIDNMSLMAKENRVYCNKILSYLEREMQRENINHYSKPVIGFYSGVKLDKKLINSYPFEIAYEIDSTLARLTTLVRWNEITSCPTFMRQCSFEGAFGFIVKNFICFYEKICKHHLRDHQMVNDSKIHLLYSIRTKIEEEINLLMPVLMLRFVGDDHLRDIQNQGKDCKSKIGKYENHLYHRILYLMYIISLLKCPLFNPDPVLRVKLICTKHMTEEINESTVRDCLCVYGLDSLTIDDLLEHKTTRKELIEIQIKKYYRIDRDKKKYVLKEERREEVLNGLKIEGDSERLLERIENWWSQIVSL